MLADLRVDELAAMRLEAFVRPLLVCPHQTRVARHIGGEDRGKTARGRHSSGIPASRRPAKKVASDKARTFGSPNDVIAFNRARLEYRSSLFSLWASASSAAARSVSPLRA